MSVQFRQGIVEEKKRLRTCSFSQSSGFEKSQGNRRGALLAGGSEESKFSVRERQREIVAVGTHVCEAPLGVEFARARERLDKHRMHVRRRVGFDYLRVIRHVHRLALADEGAHRTEERGCLRHPIAALLQQDGTVLGQGRFPGSCWAASLARAWGTC